MAIDWNKDTTDTFGEMELTPWIKLEENVPFVGVLLSVKPNMTNDFGNKYMEIWFNDNGTDRHLDATAAIAKAFMAVNPQDGDTVRILKTKTLAVDKDGNPVMGQNDKGEEEQKSYTKYKVEIATPEEAKPVKKAAKKAEPADTSEEEPATEAAPAMGEEINLDGIPF